MLTSQRSEKIRAGEAARDSQERLRASRNNGKRDEGQGVLGGPQELFLLKAKPIVTSSGTSLYVENALCLSYLTFPWSWTTQVES